MTNADSFFNSAIDWIKHAAETVIDYRAFHDVNWIQSWEAKYVGLAFALISLLLSFSHIYAHLKLYTMPEIQIYVIRILLTCPIYALASSIALIIEPYNIYAETIRDLYEALVVYSFFNMILEYCGGETDCVYAIENDPALILPFPLCLLKRRPRDARLLRFCHRGVLQFIVIKPIMTIMNILLSILGQENALVWKIVEALVYNVSYIWALYCLYVFYLAIHTVLHQFRPIAKFGTIKLVIVATYYQLFFLQLSLSSSNDTSTSVHDAKQLATLWNDFLLSLEMSIFSILFMIAFPSNEFMGGLPQNNRRILQNVSEVFTISDIFHNLYHNFTAKYGDYVLQRSENEIPSSIHVNTNLIMKNHMNQVALDMSERYRGKNGKKSFNAILRGANPVTAKMRRRIYSNSNSALSPSSSIASIGLMEGAGEEDSGHSSSDKIVGLGLRSDSAEELLIDAASSSSSSKKISKKGGYRRGGMDDVEEGIGIGLGLELIEECSREDENEDEEVEKDNEIEEKRIEHDKMNNTTNSNVNNSNGNSNGNVPAIGKLLLQLKQQQHHSNNNTTNTTNNNNTIPSSSSSSSSLSLSSTSMKYTTNTNTNHTNKLSPKSSSLSSSSLLPPPPPFNHHLDELTMTSTTTISALHSTTTNNTTITTTITTTGSSPVSPQELHDHQQHSSSSITYPIPIPNNNNHHTNHTNHSSDDDEEDLASPLLLPTTNNTTTTNNNITNAIISSSSAPCTPPPSSHKKKQYKGSSGVLTPSGEEWGDFV